MKDKKNNNKRPQSRPIALEAGGKVGGTVSAVPPAAKNIPKHEIHPAAAKFPLMGKEDQAKLANDIMKNGLRKPIVLHKRKVRSGRNRYLACVTKGVAAKSKPTQTLNEEA
jgi:hypothetical protein